MRFHPIGNIQYITSRNFLAIIEYLTSRGEKNALVIGTFDVRRDVEERLIECIILHYFVMLVLRYRPPNILVIALQSSLHISESRVIRRRQRE